MHNVLSPMPITLSYSDVHLISNISCQLLCRVVPIDDAEAFYVGVILLIQTGARRVAAPASASLQNVGYGSVPPSPRSAMQKR